MEKYWNYLKYLLEHKKNVGIECLKMGMPIHAITHDLSKFLPSEFIPYARYFYDTKKDKKYDKKTETDSNFQAGWCHHQKRNKHHWNYWVSVTRVNDAQRPIPMPYKYVKQMIADWRGMSRKFGGTWQEYFTKNEQEMILHPDTVYEINYLLICGSIPLILSRLIFEPITDITKFEERSDPNKHIIVVEDE